MRRLWVLLVIFLIGLSFGNPVRSVSALGVSSTPFFFIVEQPTTLQSSDLFFTVVNNNDYPIVVSCTYESIPGLDFQVEFTWNDQILQPDETLKNHYSITIEETYNTTFPVILDVKGYAVGESGLIGGFRIFNYVQFFGRENAYSLTLKIINQINTPVFANIRLSYQRNESFAWSPLLDINDTSLSGYYPEGWYRVVAQDPETKITGEEEFYLNNNTIKDIHLDLVRFDRFYPDFTSQGQLFVNVTIDSFISMLYDVEIYAEVAYEGNKLESTVSKGYIIPQFPKTLNYPAELTFPSKTWRKGHYDITGYIFSATSLVVRKGLSFDLHQNINVNDSVLDNQTILILFGVLTGLGIAFVPSFIRKIKEKRNNAKTHSN